MKIKTYSIPGTSWYMYFYTAPDGTVMRHIVADDTHIRQPAVADCERCQTDAYVPHFSCIYNGEKAGHSKAHCTAHSCY